MGRILCLAICCLLLCSCSPYVRRTIVSDDGTVQRYPYAYGKFCGPGYPKGLETQSKLQTRWPPMDDIDALCYAHDQCFRASNTSQVGCDSVLLDMLVASQSKYRAKGCWNDATNMSIAFFAKPYGTGYTKDDAYSSWAGQWLVGLPSSIGWATLKAPLLPFLKNSQEGTCNLAEVSNPEPIIEEFLRRYSEDAKKYGRPEIEIPFGPVEPLVKPLPDATWELPHEESKSLPPIGG